MKYLDHVYNLNNFHLEYIYIYIFFFKRKFSLMYKLIRHENTKKFEYYRISQCELGVNNFLELRS